MGTLPGDGRRSQAVARDGESSGPNLDRATLESLLEAQGALFSEELGIRLGNLDPGELFKWFIAALLFGARIRESAAVRTYRELERRDLLTPDALRNADLWDMIDVMAQGGYSRYDGITTRKLQWAAAKLCEQYAGDLNRLHDSAADSTDLVARLREFWGVGETTAGIFLRELRGLWPKATPSPGDLAHLAARHLGLGDPVAFWRANAVSGWDFRHLEAALTRMGRDYCRKRRCRQAPVPH
jgi:endonuclease III